MMRQEAGLVSKKGNMGRRLSEILFCGIEMPQRNHDPKDHNEFTSMIYGNIYSI
jgi:hypothetical protein